MNKLSSDQIEYLYKFTKQHYVPYYDLQTELVDHLALGIEKIWEENPNVSFEKALQQEFKKFGVFGFTDLVAKREQEMHKRYEKLVFKLLKTYINLPKITLAALLVLIVYVLLTNVPQSEHVIYVLIGLSVILLSVKSVQQNIKIKRQKKEGKKLWLFEQVIYRYGRLASYIYILLHFSNFLRIEDVVKILANPVGAFVLALIFSVFLVINYIVLFEIPSKAKCYIAKEHPEYNIV